MKMITKLFAVALMMGSLHPMFSKAANSLESLLTLKEIENGMVQMTYYGKTPEKLFVNIYDQENRQIFSETVNSKKGVKKPYNISTLPYGEYRFEVRVEDEIVVQTVNHAAPAYPGKVKMIAKVFADDKFKMMVMGPEYKDFKLRIYDNNHRLLFQERIQQPENYGKVINVSDTGAKSVKLVLSNNREILQTKVLNL